MTGCVRLETNTPWNADGYCYSVHWKSELSPMAKVNKDVEKIMFLIVRWPFSSSIMTSNIYLGTRTVPWKAYVAIPVLSNLSLTVIVIALAKVAVKKGQCGA